jgi:hypothetical protein
MRRDAVLQYRYRFTFGENRKMVSFQKKIQILNFGGKTENRVIFLIYRSIFLVY